VAGFSASASVDGLLITAAGDQDFSGQDDTFVITTNATNQFLTLALNGVIGLYAHQGAIAQITALGLDGSDSLTLTGTSAAETLTFNPATAEGGHASIAGVVEVDYTEVESVVLSAMGGDDTFAIGGALGRVKVIGGSGSDRIDFSAAASRVVFDLDSVGVDQFINATGQIVTLGDVIENFTGSAYNDTLRVNAANFARDLKGGANTNEIFPPGDDLSFDGQQQVVKTTLVNAATGTYMTNGYADVMFDGFETPLIANSPSGPGFGTPDNNDAFETAHVYDLTRSNSGGQFVSGRSPTSVATADLNGDGFMDMVVINYSSARISVLLNVGDGTFGSPVSYKTKGSAPQDIAIGNFDANPGLDLAVTNSGSDTLAIFSGDNLGGFSKPTLIKTAPNPKAIAVGRVDGDMIDDLIITHVGNKISRLLGTGTGFGPEALFKTKGMRPVDVVIGDFNADGLSDVITVNFYSKNVSFFQGDGLGGFAGAKLFATGRRPTALAVADFNLDGVLDIAVSNHVNNFVSVLYSNGVVAVASTQFQPQLKVALPTKLKPTSIVAADFNGDGIADLALSNNVSTNVTVLIGANFGKFSQPYEFDLGKFRIAPKDSGLAVGDFNNDGLLDIVATGRGSADARVLLRKIQSTS
jgi:hypothetical protein